MDDEFKRFEEKQKIANLQIDKRLSMMENTLDELKSSFESISTGVTERDIDAITRRLSEMKKEESDQSAQLKQLAEGFDTSKIIEEFDGLKRSFTDLRLRFEEKVRDVELLQEQLVGIERRGKLPQCEDGFEDLKYKITLALNRLESLEKKINEFERIDFSRKVSQPIIIE